MSLLDVKLLAETYTRAKGNEAAIADFVAHIERYATAIAQAIEGYREIKRALTDYEIQSQKEKEDMRAELRAIEMKTDILKTKLAQLESIVSKGAAH